MRGRLIPVVLLILFVTTAFLKGGYSDGSDRASFGSDITIAEGETVGDVACAFCSVHVRGDVGGDIAVAFGSVTVDSGHTVGGDTAILESDLRLGQDSAVHGDLAILAGSAHLSEGSAVHGSRAIVPQPLGTLLLLSPLLFFIAVIWLIVYLVRRNHYRFPAYPQGKGIYPPPPPRN